MDGSISLMESGAGGNKNMKKTLISNNKNKHSRILQQKSGLSRLGASLGLKKSVLKDSLNPGESNMLGSSFSKVGSVSSMTLN